MAQSFALAEALKIEGVSCEVHTLPEEGHSFTLEGWLSIERLFLQFLGRTLTGVLRA